MSITPLIGVPGISSARTASYRNVFKALDSARYYPGGGTIDGTKSRDGANTDNTLLLRPGNLMGKITSSKKWAPSVLGVTQSAAVASADTSLTLTAATAAELVRRVGTTGTFKLTGPPTAAGTVRTLTVTYSAVNTSTGVVTITALGVNEVQTLTFGAAATGGTMRLRVPKADGTWVTTDAITWNATDATWLAAINTALDGATGVSGGIVATGAAPDTALTFTFSGTGYAARPQPTDDMISVVLFPTSATTAVVARTTSGVDGRFVVGSFVQPTDGSETVKSFVPDGTGILIPTDSSDVYFDQIPIGGDVQSSQILNWPSDTSLRQWIVDALNLNGYGRFTFDHLMGPT